VKKANVRFRKKAKQKPIPEIDPPTGSRGDAKKSTKPLKPITIQEIFESLRVFNREIQRNLPDEEDPHELCTDDFDDDFDDDDIFFPENLRNFRWSTTRNSTRNGPADNTIGHQPQATIWNQSTLARTKEELTSSTTGHGAEVRGWPPLAPSSSPEVASRTSMSTKFKSSSSTIIHHRQRVVVKPNITVIVRAPASSSDRRHLLHPRHSTVGIIIVTDAKSKTLLF